ncbi:MAG: hypothetical protein Q9186_004310 [Xanthomendoza sp. 1 TL-2023]
MSSNDGKKNDSGNSGNEDLEARLATMGPEEILRILTAALTRGNDAKEKKEDGKSARGDGSLEKAEPHEGEITKPGVRGVEDLHPKETKGTSTSGAIPADKRGDKTDKTMGVKSKTKKAKTIDPPELPEEIGAATKGLEDQRATRVRDEDVKVPKEDRKPPLGGVLPSYSTMAQQAIRARPPGAMQTGSVRVGASTQRARNVAIPLEDTGRAIRTLDHRDRRPPASTAFGMLPKNLYLKEGKDWWWLETQVRVGPNCLEQPEIHYDPKFSKPGVLWREFQRNPLVVTDARGNYRWQAMPPPRNGEHVRVCAGWGCGSRKHHEEQCPIQPPKCMGCGATGHVWTKCPIVCEWCRTPHHNWFFCSSIEKGTMGKDTDAKTMPGIFRPRFLEAGGEPLKGHDLLPLLKTPGVMSRRTLQDCAEELEETVRGPKPSARGDGPGRDARVEATPIRSAKVTMGNTAGTIDTTDARNIHTGKNLKAMGSLGSATVGPRSTPEATQESAQDYMRKQQERVQRHQANEEKYRRLRKQRKEDNKATLAKPIPEFPDCYRRNGELCFNSGSEPWKEHREANYLLFEMDVKFWDEMNVGTRFEDPDGDNIKVHETAAGIIRNNYPFWGAGYDQWAEEEGNITWRQYWSVRGPSEDQRTPVEWRQYLDVIYPRGADEEEEEEEEEKEDEDEEDEDEEDEDEEDSEAIRKAKEREQDSEGEGSEEEEKAREENESVEQVATESEDEAPTGRTMARGVSTRGWGLSSWADEVEDEAEELENRGGLEGLAHLFSTGGI